MKEIEILKSTPNNYETFNLMLLLAHTLHEKDGQTYFAKIDWKGDFVSLIRVEQ